MSAMPEAYWAIVAPLIDKAREILERGESLVPFAFVGASASRRCVPVAMESSSETAKDRSAEAVKAAAELIDADFVFVVMEAWSLRKDKLAKMKSILEKYGSIGASPYAVDIVSMSRSVPPRSESHWLSLSRSRSVPAAKAGAAARASSRASIGVL